MPRFNEYVDVDIDIDVDDFLNACSSRDIDELVDALIEDGHISKRAKLSYDSYSAAESDFQDALEKLQGKWNRLTSEEEQAILAIAKRF